MNVKVITQNGTKRESPLFKLSEGDQAFIVDLVLESGSLKGLAKVYSVSYPTIRGRLDKVIERLKGAIEGRPVDPLREFLADQIRRGSMNVDTARRITDLADQRVSIGYETEHYQEGEGP